MNQTIMMNDKSQVPLNNTNPSGFNKLKLKLEKGTSSSLTRKSSSNLEEPKKQPTKFFTKPSIMNLHRRQRSVDEVMYDTQKLRLTKSRSRSSSPTKLKGHFINSTPEIQTVSNFSSPTKSIRSSTGSIPESPIFESESSNASIPRINITEPQDQQTFRHPFHRDSTSKFGKLRKKTLSMFFDQNTSSLTPLTPIHPQQLDPLYQQRPKLNKSHSENDGNTTTIPSAESDVNTIKLQQDLTRKRSKTMGSVEDDLYHKRNGSIVKTIGSMMMLKPKNSNQDSASASQTSLDSEPQPLSRSQSPPAIGEYDSPEEYVSKLINEGFEFEVTSILSLSDSEFLKNCLNFYITEKFDFYGIALDIALRMFLMSCELPKEAQQIDRVLDSFSVRYYYCNIDLWDNSDQIYFLTFSLVMLHTDYYNVNNKKKMTKEEFVKNTRIDTDETISTSFLTKELLEYLYDNIVYTKFVKSHDFSKQQPPAQAVYSLPKKLFSSTSSTNLEAMNNPHRTSSSSQLRSSSFSSTTSQIFSSTPVVDPYQVIIADQLDSLKLDLDPVNFRNPFENSFDDFLKEELLNSVRGQLQKNQGVFIRYNKDCNWLTSKTEIHFNNPDEVEYGKRVLLKVIKVAEIFREETVVNSKFFTIGTTSRIIWKKYYGFLTTCGFFLFDTINFLSIAEREKIANGDFGDKPFVIDIYLDFILRSSLKYSINGLFACPTKDDEKETFQIFSTNKREMFATNTYEEMSSWISSINYIAALDSCFIDTPIENNHEVAPLRSITIEDKISKLEKNKAASIIRIEYFLKIIQHIETLTPFSQRTREHLINHYKSISIKIDWLWYEIERNLVYTNILRHELSLDDKHSLRTNDEQQSFLEESFINDDYYRTLKDKDGRIPLKLQESSDEAGEEDASEEEGSEGDFVDAYMNTTSDSV